MPNKLPPLFDDISDEELKEQGVEQAELVNEINNLRIKSLEGGGLTDDEVRNGIRMIVELRKIRAGGKKENSELPQVLEEKLEELF